MSLQPLNQNLLPGSVIVPYGWMGKILKVAVFNMALGKDLIYRISSAVYHFFSRLCGGDRGFDPQIAQRSLDRFVALGAKTQFVTPRDGKGQVQMMTFQAKDLEAKIQALGGAWERRSVQEKNVFAIVPPLHPGEDWDALQENLKVFRWREEEGMLITCESADAVDSNAPSRCFLYAHALYTCFAQEWRRARFYIGAKQDLCFFDNGNTWQNSGRPPSEESFYLEIEAVYNQIKDEYSIDRLWVGGFCMGAPVGAYLKRLFHDQGINFFAEQSFPDLDDFVKPMSPFFAPRVKGVLSDQALVQTIANPPPSCQFGVERLWAGLSKYEGSHGKVILVQVEDDERVKPEAYQRYLALAQKINTNVTHLVYTSLETSPHTDQFFRYEDPCREFLTAVFN